MFAAVIFLESRREHVAALKAALIGQASRAPAADPRCHSFEAAEDPVDPLSFLVIARFESEEAYRAHVELPVYAQFAVMIEPWTTSRRVLTYSMLEKSGRA